MYKIIYFLKYIFEIHNNNGNNTNKYSKRLIEFLKKYPLLLFQSTISTYYYIFEFKKKAILLSVQTYHKYLIQNKA